ncbi:MAG TPA: TetR/AcrR family transcriptional regulator [Sandaracinaceae bacterium LLY-WYZ-13_1]|nr:TetR/AcrR family transcriptional regulator [Sandaracinaceae bacterium LLY-WYZ-13_1]
MPLPRFEKLPEDKRRAILHAAAEEFSEHGFDGASFNRIIDAAGISKGAMYYYFADKADAYGAVLDDVLARMWAIVEDIEEPTDAEGFWRWMEIANARTNAAFLEDPELGALARQFYRSGDADPVYRRLMAQAREWLMKVLADGQALGAIRDDLPLEMLAEAAMGLGSAMDRWFADVLEDRPVEEVRPLMAKALELTRDLLEDKARR